MPEELYSAVVMLEQKFTTLSNAFKLLDRRVTMLTDAFKLQAELDKRILQQPTYGIAIEDPDD